MNGGEQREAPRIPDPPPVARALGRSSRPGLPAALRQRRQDEEDGEGGGEDHHTHAPRGPAPSRPRGDKGHAGRPRHLAQIAREIERPQGHAAASFLVGSGDQRGRQGVLGAGTQAAEHQKGEKEREATGRAEAEEADRRDERPGRQDARLAPALGQESRRHLKEGERTGIPGAQQPDLREGKRELARPHREEDIKEVGAAIVQEVDDAARNECGAGSAWAHSGDSFNRPPNCQARSRECFASAPSDTKRSADYAGSAPLAVRNGVRRFRQGSLLGESAPSA